MRKIVFALLCVSFLGGLSSVSLYGQIGSPWKVVKEVVKAGSKKTASDVITGKWKRRGGITPGVIVPGSGYTGSIPGVTGANGGFTGTELLIKQKENALKPSWLTQEVVDQTRDMMNKALAGMQKDPFDLDFILQMDSLCRPVEDIPFTFDNQGKDIKEGLVYTASGQAAQPVFASLQGQVLIVRALPGGKTAIVLRKSSVPKDRPLFDYVVYIGSITTSLAPGQSVEKGEQIGVITEPAEFIVGIGRYRVLNRSGQHAVIPELCVPTDTIM